MVNYNERVQRQKLFLKGVIKGKLMQIWKFHYVRVHVKTIRWKFCIRNPKNSRVVYPWKLCFS